mmetsp:Transcript_9771/g.17608  ORF Transcript_9771/g.17608 Transcript_9771/m.17608 type:complete len:105 (-) Transcript_9771:908-1222(-)
MYLILIPCKVRLYVYTLCSESPTVYLYGAFEFECLVVGRSKRVERLFIGFGMRCILHPSQSICIQAGFFLCEPSPETMWAHQVPSTKSHFHASTNVSYSLLSQS